jgi:hypothetical protein
LTTTALDMSWTNLPAKPFFVPLVHETLRSTIDRLRPPLTFEPGDTPQLGFRWESVGRVTTPSQKTLLLIRESKDETTGKYSAVHPIEPLGEAGIYRSATDALIVNVNPDAANTNSAPPEVMKSLLAEFGRWNTLALDQPFPSQVHTASSANYGWQILWLVLLFALIETWFARRVSHARLRISEAHIP